jgi:hypothetical protein
MDRISLRPGSVEPGQDHDGRTENEEQAFHVQDSFPGLNCRVGLEDSAHQQRVVGFEDLE